MKNQAFPRRQVSPAFQIAFIFDKKEDNVKMPPRPISSISKYTGNLWIFMHIDSPEDYLDLILLKLIGRTFLITVVSADTMRQSMKYLWSNSRDDLRVDYQRCIIVYSGAEGKRRPWFMGKSGAEMGLPMAWLKPRQGMWKKKRIFFSSPTFVDHKALVEVVRLALNLLSFFLPCPTASFLFSWPRIYLIYHLHILIITHP